MKRDWSTLPHSHAGKWEAKYNSVMNPGAKCTFPQLISQWVIETRTKYLKSFPKIQKGKGWSLPIAKQVRSLCQQAATLCDYFSHPDEDPLVEAAFKNFFSKNRVFKIGQYRKYRVSKNGKLNITQDEKDIINAIEHEYKLLKEKKDNIKHAEKVEVPTTDEKITTKVQPVSRKKGRFSDLIELEESINGSN